LSISDPTGPNCDQSIESVPVGAAVTRILDARDAGAQTRAREKTRTSKRLFIFQILDRSIVFFGEVLGARETLLV
jgi:hypothetical protein